MLGGTGGLNYMLYVRGNKDDFDHWATLGNRGWSYEEVGDIFYVVMSSSKSQQKNDRLE